MSSASSLLFPGTAPELCDVCMFWGGTKDTHRKKLTWQRGFEPDHGFLSQHFMANRWGNKGKSDRVYFLGLQNHCRWWLQPWNKRHFLLGRKAMTDLHIILKSRDITLPKNVHIAKAMFFLLVMCGCDSWTIKKAEHWRLILLNCGVREDSRVPWAAKRSNQSILKKISSEYSLEGLMLKLKLK